MSDFRPAPNYNYYLPEKKNVTLDPATSWLIYYPRLRSILSTVKFNFKPQALHAFQIKEQCFSDFIFQRSPYVIEACGNDNKKFVEPGADYLATYWLAVFNGLITKDQ